MRELIHFVHGNGFPSQCYRQLLTRLESQYECCYLDRVGHTSLFPVTDNWHYLVKEVIFSIQAQASKPVIGLGHSLGGVLSLLAAIERPDLFKMVVLLDSPMFGRMKSLMLRIFKTFGVIDRVTPASQTRKRRQHWVSREQALTYLHRRALFKSFDQACLQDYIDFGMAKDETGYFLRFDPQIEYQIYRTIPHLSYALEGQLKVPAALIYGDQSHLIRNADLRYMKRKYDIEGFEIHGSHMFPMEHPALSAAKVMDVIDVMLNKEK